MKKMKKIKKMKKQFVSSEMINLNIGNLILGTN